MDVRGKVIALALVTSALVGACDDADNIREDVLLCEQAIAHLQDCCGRSIKADCEYLYDVRGTIYCDPDCPEDKEHLPDLSAQSSRCILRSDCNTLSRACASQGAELTSTCQ